MKLVAVGATIVLAAFAVGAIACAPAPDARENDDDANASSALIDGFDVRDPRADAVGSLGFVYGPDVFDAKCTGTLIARDAVLTAKHCVKGSIGEAPYVDDRDMGFAIGFDAAHPRKVVKLASVKTFAPDEGGYIAFGRDVAIYTLAEPVDDVPPLRVTENALGEDDVGKRFWAAGYGAQDYERRTRGTRRAGAVTLRAVSGAPMHRLFPEREAFLSFMNASEGERWVAEKQASLETFFDYVLLPGYEIYVGLGEAQPCDGDSGGPLVRQIGNDYEVVAVVSGSRKGANGRCSVLGEFYANVDRASLALVGGENPGAREAER